MKKIITYLIIGLILLISGIIVLEFAGLRHMTKGAILCVAGFILSGAYGLTFLQVRKQFLKKKDRKICSTNKSFIHKFLKTNFKKQLHIVVVYTIFVTTIRFY